MICIKTDKLSFYRFAKEKLTDCFMRKLFLIKYIFLLLLISACNTEKGDSMIENLQGKVNVESEINDKSSDKMYIIVNGKYFDVELQQNKATRELMKILSDNDIILDMSDYDNMEKLAQIYFRLTRNDVRMTTSPGDIVLYSGRYIVAFYGKNTWSYTLLGRVVQKNEFSQELSKSRNVRVTFSLKK